MNSGLAERLRNIESEIARVCERVGRSPEEVKLLCVSKGQPVERMVELAKIYAGRGQQACFGENYVQEIKEKKSTLPSGTSVHMIGALQRNKAKDAVQLFDCIQSVHSAALAQELNQEAAKRGLVKDILLQVNISADPSKSGFAAEDVLEFVAQLDQLPALRFCGLMTITALYENPENARPDFRALAQLKNTVLSKLTNPPAHFELSMGMSQDYQIAMEEGATIVRVGTALFGER